jgi:hypothetical protein
MTVVKSTIISDSRKRVLLLPVLLVFSTLCLLLPSCSREKGGNTSNINDSKTNKSVESEQAASSPAVEELKKLKPEDMLKEIRARELSVALDVPDTILERQSEGIAHQPLLANPTTDPSLAKYSSFELTVALLDKQKAIYGQDNRKDVYLITSNPKLNAAANAVVSLFRSSRLVPLGDGSKTKIVNKMYGTEYRLCDTEPPVEPFLKQPCSAFCSGVLVAPDIIATAGHCVSTAQADGIPLSDIRFVFGYRMRDETTAELIIDNGEIYSGEQIIKRIYTPDGPDWALIRLDRPVKGHTPALIRRTSKISDAEDLYVIGHPCGLPAKFADGAVVRTNTNADFFVANLDTYAGNSGSPVFNSTTHEVEGILVRGEKDYIARNSSQPNSCQISLKCPNTGCRGEDCTRTTVFAHLVPAP